MYQRGSLTPLDYIDTIVLKSIFKYVQNKSFPFYIVNIFLKLNKTFWTYSMQVAIQGYSNQGEAQVDFPNNTNKIQHELNL